MRKMRIILAGMGSFGTEWFERVLPLVPEAETVGLVSRRADWAAERFQIARGNVFQRVEGALDALRPDLLLVVTPPNTHAAYTIPALRLGIPVLCEKPIAGEDEDASEMLRTARETGVPLYIAENYRYFASLQRMRDILASGCMGKMNSISMDFYRTHVLDNYHMKLEQPILLDIAAHHFDCLRFLTGSDGAEVSACAFAPPWGVYKRNCNAFALLTMENGVRVSYRGGLACRCATDWIGVIRVDCQNGVLTRMHEGIDTVYDDSVAFEAIPDEGESRALLLRDVLRAIQTHSPAPTAAEDNWRSFAMVSAAIHSAENGGTVEKVRNELL